MEFGRSRFPSIVKEVSQPYSLSPASHLLLAHHLLLSCQLLIWPCHAVSGSQGLLGLSPSTPQPLCLLWSPVPFQGFLFFSLLFSAVLFSLLVP
ncbi:hypothetical protein GDO78_002292 [Eleutherodactylus coqui]|uniref:Uncharacterized protein n=1 Tax=Eleutherodactylus coqui TaxID=57060 RepID=A0A8J6K264_ELECQ|nr:hypothetical protein GDO78_002292 [Eleutherodactylus coqui]